MEKNEKILVEVELADRFKIVLHNRDNHMGCFYIEDEWDITIYSPTIEDLITQATIEMVQRLIDVDEWTLEQCQVLIYNGNLYEVEESAKDIKAEHSTLVDDIISTDSYKEAYKTRQEELAADLLKIQEHYQEKYKREQEERKRKAKEKDRQMVQEDPRIKIRIKQVKDMIKQGVDPDTAEFIVWRTPLDPPF